MSDHLFVYGTLRSECGHPMHRLLTRHAERVGMARYAGRLYDLGGYPGVVPEPAAAPSVRGELYRLREPRALWPSLDRYEGCTDPGDAGAEYRRERQAVLREDGTPVQAWMYLYNRPTDGLRPIPGGDFLQRTPSPPAPTA
jgi:gamma-glutamylcyclotransferase (GGCT)/AIG2-like uncharacterized protein YtfP